MMVTIYERHEYKDLGNKSPKLVSKFESILIDVTKWKDIVSRSLWGGGEGGGLPIKNFQLDY